MSRIAYVNGQYVLHAQAQVHVEDRGYQFADGVYEVCEVRGGKVIDETRHLDRLDRSLGELKIRQPMGRAALKIAIREMLRRNRVRNGLIYMQVTRGVARRDHIFPSADVLPAVVLTVKHADFAKAEAAAAQGIAVITRPDNRWERVDIKSVSLLPNILARQEAKERGAREALFVDAQGFITEGAATNAWMVTHQGEIITRPAHGGILKGITRTTLMELAEKLQMKVIERPFTVEEAQNAAEVFITAATTLVMPVVKVDDKTIGNGRPGAFATRLRAEFHTQAEAAE